MIPYASFFSGMTKNTREYLWPGYAIITYHRPTQGTTRKRHRTPTATRQQYHYWSKAITYQDGVVWYLIVSIPDLCTLTYFKDLSIYEMVGAWCFGCLSGPPGFTCWISFAPIFSFIYLSLLYLLFISWFICPRRWCFDKLGVFHANQTSMCLNPHLN